MPPSSSSSPSDYFTSAARTAAIGDALSLVGTYFQDGGRLNDPTPALHGGNNELGDLIEALRLRVAIAAAHRLSGIVERALSKPNFRYGTRREDAIGSVRGRLDLQTLIRRNGRFDAPPRYPVVIVERQFATPENVLLACALMWVRRELRAPVIGRLGDRSAERSESIAAVSRIDRDLKRAELRGCRDKALERLTHGELEQLCGEVERRIAAGHVNGAFYLPLVEWVRACIAGHPAAEPGEIEWSFYGSEFDARLFEIWLLGQLRTRLAAAAGIDPDPWDFFHSVSPLDTSTSTNSRLRLVYQRSLKNLRGDGAEVRWHAAGTTRALGEIPDYLVGLDSPTAQRTIVVDAKLRQRSSPTEEIYKLLGYFNNYGTDAHGLGAIIFYSAYPNDVATHDYLAAEGGRVIAFSVDPERPAANEAGWAALIDLIGLS